LGLDPRPLEPPPELAAEARAIHDAEIGTDAFVDEVRAPGGPPWRTGEHRAAGGTIRAHLRLRPGSPPVIQDVTFEGDFFVAPPRAVPDLEAALKDAPLATAPAMIRAFFAQAAEITMLGLAPDDFVSAFALASPGATDSR
jgi:lipoate---protein ligase